MEEGHKKKRRLTLNKVLLWLNIFLVFVTFLSYAGVSFSPAKMGYLTLIGLSYPLILAANILFIIIWMFRRRRFMVFSLFAILIGTSFLLDFINFSFGVDAAAEDWQGLEVMTYNVHLFGLYDKEGSEEKRDEIFDLLKGESPDILCFQEFFHSDQRGYFTTKDSLLKFLPTKYFHARYTHAKNGRNYFGVAMFSKYPIINKGFIPFESDVNNFCIYADIKYKGDTIRVYNAHLQSIRFKPEDYAFVDENKNKEKLDAGVKRIAWRLKKAFEKREEQVKKVVESVASCKHPVLMCGDFNDPPVSFTYGLLSEHLEDSFKSCGSGIGNTYNGVFPSFRIDYILHSKDFRADYYRSVNNNLSDHYPVVAGFTLLKNR
jgi:endonuclease/exonuclease/phosphatase family metal-dependent hydrolase